MATSSHNLVVDIGNSGIKAASYLDGALVGEVFRLPADSWPVIDRTVTNLGVQNIIYSSVANVPPDGWIDKWKSEGRLVVELSETVLSWPFVSEYRSPATLGQDRIAAVAGSIGLVDGPKLIIDAGSCITADLVTTDARYLGGNISPGVAMRLHAMHEGTSRLPLIWPGTTKGRVGLETESALRHGGQLGAVYEIEGLYFRLSSDFPGLRLLLTGGDAHYLQTHFSVPVFVYPNLVLRGLNQILSKYVNQ